MSITPTDYLTDQDWIFVTGGSGFLGRQLIQDLIIKGYRVHALTRSATSAKTVRQIGAEPVMGDLDDIDAMSQGMTDCALVIHAAAKVEQWGAWQDFEQMTVQGTKNVITAARKAGVKRLVHISTEAVLAGGQAIIQANEQTLLPKKATGFYPLSKKLAEQVVLAANDQQLTTIVMRPRFIWGVGDSTLLPKLAQAAKQGGWLWFGGGKHQMSTCHVKNVTHGVILAANKGQAGQVYFLTDGQPVIFKEFVGAMIATQGVNAGQKQAPMWLADLLAATSEWVWKTFKLKGEPPITKTAVNLFFKEVTINDKKARDELGYQAVITIEQGLKELENQRLHA